MTPRPNSSLKRRVQQAASIMGVASLSSGIAGAQTTAARPLQIAGSAPVAGKVLTPDGKPVKEATVYWIERTEDGDVQRRLSADTDVQGQFRFPAAEPLAEGHSVTLLVRAADWGLTFQPLPAAVTAPLAITLEPPLSLRVPFTDQAGKPLPRLHIRVEALYVRKIGFLRIPAALHGRWEQTTNAKGECVFPDLPRGAQVRFAVQEEAFATPAYEDAITLGNDAAQQVIPIQLLPGGVVQGRVTNSEDGKPAAGIRVGAQAVGIADGWGETTTDSTGAYRLVGLRPGAYNVAVFLRGDREKDVTAHAYEKMEIKPGVALTAQDFKLIPGSRITGKVTDQSTGQPIGGVMIGIYGPAHPRSGAAVQSTTTGPDGVYHARVPAGPQYVYVIGPPSNRFERPKEGVSITVGEDASLTQDFALTPSLAQNLKPVHGHVVGANGKPVPGARVIYVPVSVDDYIPGGREIEANTTGAFSVEMTSASARLRARSGDMATDTTMLVQSGDEITLHLKPNALLTLGGHVTNDKGKPLANARVMLVEWWLDSGRGNVSTRTDAEGRFTFTGLYPDSRFSVSAEAAGYGVQGTEIAQYKPGDKVVLPAIQLPRADSFVAGRVVDDNGDPIARQSVRLQGRNNKYQEAITDARGRFRFEAVVNEPLTLYLYDDGTGFSPRKTAMAGDKEVIIVRKSRSLPGVHDDQENQAATHKQQTALLSHPGPALKAAAWINTSTPMPDGLNGKIVLVDFWSINCGPCVAALPAVQKASEQFAGRGVVVVGVHDSGIEKDRLTSFVRAHNLTYPIALDMDDPKRETFGQIMRGYGVTGIPTVAVLDRQGIVRYLDYGLEGAVKVIGDLLAREKP
jgi:thiol-disulfide isomerase/thioredoxin/uncharacterized GH25 family protein